MSHFGRAGPPDIRDTYSLLVLNITFRTSADDLYPLFDRYGKVVDIFIPRDRRTGESRGFAFVRYKHAEEAQKAIERLDGRNVDGRDMVVQYAKYGRDMESIHRGKITQGSPKYTSRSRSRSPTRRPNRSPVRGGGRRHFGPPSHMQASPPRGRDGRDRYPGPPQGGRSRDTRDDYREREREREHRPRSRSRDRYERDRYREREREHPRRRSPSRSRSRSRGRANDEERHRSQSKAAGRKSSPAPRSPSPGRNGGRSASRSISPSPPPRVSTEPSKEATRNGNDSPHDRKRMDSVSPKQQSLSPERGMTSPARLSSSPVERDSLSPAKRRSETSKSLCGRLRTPWRRNCSRRHTRIHINVEVFRCAEWGRGNTAVAVVATWR
ncbi:hypothetical protein R1flu_007364 [Riccia fluitans]|uniref:RRM domain-containing protein n=1 Tax=Riccia fluitans TaxID=41844 RepID=A0ABD1YYN1_9MARC